AGLVVKGPLVEFTIPVATVTRDTVRAGYDAILLSCKAYDLEDAIESIRPAAPGALIVPLLNGIKHLDRLDREFGQAAIAGGLAQISITLDPDGTIRHLAPMQGFIFGARDPSRRSAPRWRRCSRKAASTRKTALPSSRTCGKNSSSSARSPPPPA
ncbi:MAG TPA: 2-dehydropantoate 2-reductase N-terminal domain-containing protein, partial [Acetobacteraceae bacterium]